MWKNWFMFIHVYHLGCFLFLSVGTSLHLITLFFCLKTLLKFFWQFRSFENKFSKHFFVWKPVLILFLNDIFSGYRIPRCDDLIFSWKIRKHFHGLLTCIVADEKSIITLICSLCIIYLVFPFWPLVSISVCHSSLRNFIMMWLVLSWFLFCLGFISLWDIWAYIFN